MLHLYENYSTPIYNAASPVAYTDLDLSPYVGAQQVLVFLAMRTTAGAGTSHFRVRTKGDPTDQPITNDGHGTTVWDGGSSTQNIWVLILVQTDVNGFVEWNSSIAYTTEVRVIAWEDDWTNIEANLLTGAMPVVYGDLDISAHIGSARRVAALFRYRYQGGGGADAPRALRPKGEALSPLGASYRGMSYMAGNVNLDRAEYMFLPTDEDGVVQHIANGVHNVICDLIGFTENIWGDETIVFPSGTPPTTYTEMDLSSVLGMNECIAYLKIKKTGGWGLIQHVGFRRHGDDGDYMVNPGNNSRAAGIITFKNTNEIQYTSCPTDENGVVDWRAISVNSDVEISVIGFSPNLTPTGPEIVSVYPSGVVTEDVEHVKVVIGGDFPVDASTIELSVTTPDGKTSTAISGGVVQTGWTGTITDLTLRVIVDLTAWPDGYMDAGKTYSFEVDCENNLGIAI